MLSVATVEESSAECGSLKEDAMRVVVETLKRFALAAKTALRSNIACAGLL